MPIDIEEHPEAPSPEELGEFVVEPVPLETIRERRERGEHLVETNLLEHDEVNVYVELDDPGPGHENVGTVLYRLVQLFGTPQFPEFFAGNDITDRADTTFKYLLEVHETDEDGRSERNWLVTVHDWHVRFGVSLAAWSEDPDDEPAVEPTEAVPLVALLTNAVTEPVECEFEEKYF